MLSKYPSPCLSCDKEYCKKNGFSYKQCAQWLTWFRWWWKRFRSAAGVIMVEVPDNPNKFRYSHPDHVKRYLQVSPCAACSVDLNCDKPCRAYLRWYDARMEIVRKKVRM